ncbi:MAG TPA: glycosyltransferase [Balneolaceae bacterium]|nr:glycosyltransferase [Balneolaceae bacterium]
MNNDIHLSVVIPTYKRVDGLARCLDCLAPGTQTLSFDQYEVIVTDDEGEGSKSQKLVQEKYSWAHWVAGPGCGPAANRNNGAKKAKGDWLVFTDDDCLPDKNWLAAIWEAKLSDENVDVIEGKTIADQPKPSSGWEAPINEDGGNLWSCNMAIHKNCFDELEGFDEEYPVASVEDIDFHKRIKLANYIIEFAPGALVVHPWRRIPDFNTLIKKQEAWKRYYMKYPEDLKLYSWKYFIGQAFSLTKAIFWWGIGKIDNRNIAKEVVRSINALKILGYKIYN